MEDYKIIDVKNIPQSNRGTKRDNSIRAKIEKLDFDKSLVFSCDIDKVATKRINIVSLKLLNGYPIFRFWFIVFIDIKKLSEILTIPEIINKSSCLCVFHKPFLLLLVPFYNCCKFSHS